MPARKRAKKRVNRDRPRPTDEASSSVQQRLPRKRALEILGQLIDELSERLEHSGLLVFVGRLGSLGGELASIVAQLDEDRVPIKIVHYSWIMGPLARRWIYEVRWQFPPPHHRQGYNGIEADQIFDALTPVRWRENAEVIHYVHKSFDDSGWADSDTLEEDRRELLSCLLSWRRWATTLASSLVLNDDGFTPTIPDWEILEVLSQRKTRCKADAICVRGIGLRVLKQRLPVLEKHGLVDRAEGPRSGYAITAKGKELLRTLSGSNAHAART